MNGTERLEAVRVVVPARDEAAHLPAHLASTALAVRRLARPDLDVTVTVVLDDCRDGSEAILAQHPEVRAVAVAHRCVGAARAAGVVPPPRPERTWLACTDADSTVPPDWLVEHVRLAEEGADLVTGTVRLAGAEPGVLRSWHQRHVLGDGHHHVHGANLGVRLSAYDAVGGFAPVASGEDVRLVEAVRAAGFRVVATAAAPVSTSARTSGRAPAGFAAYLLAIVN